MDINHYISSIRIINWKTNNRNSVIDIQSKYETESELQPLHFLYP